MIKLQPAVAPDECIGRAVMLKFRLPDTFQFGNNAFHQYLAQIDATLIEGIDMPDHPLGEGRVWPLRSRCLPRGQSERGELLPATQARHFTRRAASTSLPTKTAASSSSTPIAKLPSAS